MSVTKEKKEPPNNKKDKVPTVKIVLVGDTKVGKSTLLVALSRLDTHEKGYSASLEIPVKQKNRALSLPPIARFYDLRSQRFFPYLHSLFYNHAKGAVIVFDITCRSSFESVPKWCDIIWGHTGEIPVLVVGNKADLRDSVDDSIAVTEIKELIQQLSSELGFNVPYIEISAKEFELITALNVPDCPLVEAQNPPIDSFRKPFVLWLRDMYVNNNIK